MTPLDLTCFYGDFHAVDFLEGGWEDDVEALEQGLRSTQIPSVDSHQILQRMRSNSPRLMNRRSPPSKRYSYLLSRVTKGEAQRECRARRSSTLPALFALAAVCKHWKRLACSRPRLWKYLVLDVRKTLRPRNRGSTNASAST